MHTRRRTIDVVIPRVWARDTVQNDWKFILFALLLSGILFDWATRVDGGGCPNEIVDRGMLNHNDNESN